MGIMEIFGIISLAVSIGMHEYAHAYVSYRLWDPTPKLQGRLTPNPLKQIDPIWTVILPLILIFSWSPMVFGWAKPVQINPMYYKNPRKWELMVALAGPTMNLILAILGILIILIYTKLIGMPLNYLQLALDWKISDIMITFWMSFSFLNIFLGIFNIIPIAPLDWYRLIKIWWYKWAEFMEKNARFWFIFVIVLVYFASPILAQIANFIFGLLLTIIGQIFY